ncbi:alanine racemase [Candidatus Nitrosoglobus terrae]|uniref:alanine racemase n=1 Tax=Candidatus Nitrosoglobus terrae TaxID=1630141 RepID=UPI000BBAB9B9|nr:alanine racemase [Candidatus Nitrosoglobus terrae]
MNYPQAIIDIGGLRHNLQQVRKLAPYSQIMAVVKADGYAHGLEGVVRSLSTEADAFAVSRLEEALMLRQAGHRYPIVLLTGVGNKEELQLAAAYHLTPVIHDVIQLDLLRQSLVTTPLAVWIKVDTGMHRLGFPPERVTEVIASLRCCQPVASIMGLMSHLANADQVEDSYTRQQLEVFNNISAPGLARSIANSAAIMTYPQAHLNWVRPGIMLYGVSPFTHCTGMDMGLKPVMTLKSCLIAIHRLCAGDKVGYGITWTCSKPTIVGVAAIGYGDGYPRHAVSGTPVLVNGYPVPLIGRVSMDMITLDLDHQPTAKVGDPVVVWGERLPVEEIAHHAATIPYELLCQVTARVPRIWNK